MPFCAHCGTELDPGVKFCGECGQSVSGMPVSETGRPTSPLVGVPPEAPPKKRKKSKLYWFVLVVAVPLIILGVLYSWYGKEFLDQRAEEKVVTKEKAIEKKSEPPVITPPKKQTPILDGRKEKVVTKEKAIEKKSKPPVTTTPRKQNPILDGRVVAVRFFESGYGVLPRNERIYKTDFRTIETRFLNWELSFEHPPPGSQIDYEIEVVCRRDGSVYMQKTTWARLEPGWTSSQHVSGWGSHNLGTWPMGAYRIEFHVEGKKIAEESFRIY